MANDINDVLAQVAALNAKVADVAQAVSDGDASVKAEIARVEALIAAGQGATPAQLQAVLDGLGTASASLDTAKGVAAGIKAEADAERP